jgi:hypothetical protein
MTGRVQYGWEEITETILLANASHNTLLLDQSQCECPVITHVCQACRSEVGGSFIEVLIAGDKVR